MVMSFIVGFVLGGIFTTLFWMYGQLRLEKSYVEQGIAKINMKWYSIVPIQIEYKTTAEIRKENENE